MTIIGLNLSTGVAPGVLWRDTTGPTGVITLRSGATFANATRDTLFVWAIARSPASVAVVEQRNWVLEPGAPTIRLGPPPAGTYWSVYSQTALQRNYGNAAKWAGIGVVLGLAAVGAFTLAGHPVGRLRL